MTDSHAQPVPVSSPEVYVGVDVSKARLDVYIDPTGQTPSVDNTAAGIATLIRQLKAMNVKLAKPVEVRPRSADDVFSILLDPSRT